MYETQFFLLNSEIRSFIGNLKNSTHLYKNVYIACCMSIWKISMSTLKKIIKPVFNFYTTLQSWAVLQVHGYLFGFLSTGTVQSTLNTLKSCAFPVQVYFKYLYFQYFQYFFSINKKEGLTFN